MEIWIQLANQIQQQCNMMSLLFVYVVFGPILHILILHNQYAVCLWHSGLLLQMTF